MTESSPARKARLRPRPLSRISIQSKLMVMLLLSGIVSVAVVTFIELGSGRGSLREAVSERLIELRESQKRAVEFLFKDLTNSLIVYTHGSDVMDAVTGFSAGFDQLANATISPTQQQAIAQYYTTKLVKPTEQMTGEKLDLQALLPTSNAQKYLQANYTAKSAAGDPSAWSAVNARFDDYFREIVTRFEYRDALLLDTRGDVVYTVNKGPDLGTNILTGPYRESILRSAYQKALGANAKDFVWITDFQPYQPEVNAPTAWLVSPVIDTAGQTQGVLALPLPTSKINRIMTANRGWEAAGMGRTTDIYLAGSDSLMRSDSRMFLENQAGYRREAIAGGTPPDVVDKAIQLGSTILVQPVASAGLRDAQRGQSGVVAGVDYLGNKELEAYAPLDIPNSDLHWSILATRDNSEAFAKVEAFTKKLVLTSTAIIFVICVASILLAQIFVRPIRRLEAGAERISAGDYSVKIPVTSRDEIGDLTAAFNEMSRSLEIKEELLQEQRRENDRLLLSLMPEPVMQRYREGEQTIAQEHQDVTVIFADIIGLDEMSNQLSGDELVRIVDDLVRQFDSAAETLGVERIRTLHNGYLASCGVNIPRLDNVHRSVEFALEMQRIIERFNSQTGNELALRAGINTGKVVSGLVGRSTVVYDMWGAAVNLAYQMHSGSPQPGIYVTSHVHDVMADVAQFTLAGSISVGGVEEPIWRLADRQNV
ncbi:putative cyclase (adenylyl-or guanylyl-)(adenylate-or guanylate-) [Mycobacterium tuberculosis H37Rv] [Mycobacterium shimoidei]|uniref:Putative cyclase (Adenylyl-or guanylyl-)(Adenylate-or guanylate-) [Mycobacterium tuberculosis H37Rv] n=2 Tax=Mycobacterium shimoidei TaxID=29313 RepID=A0A375Z080_MYCSH|nr:putative cyclase (adenylyl-or guanylyl-)(adenylate-or guanylate-) [Mycobacterium tuberculosis H37Rv] [Mycobacterium shimoidei]